ncbi:MAG: hypothetical protein ABI863_08655 [Ginsengibacter sp.]
MRWIVTEKHFAGVHFLLRLFSTRQINFYILAAEELASKQTSISHFYFCSDSTLNQSTPANPESFVCDSVVQDNPTSAPIHLPY